MKYTRIVAALCFIVVVSWSFVSDVNAYGERIKSWSGRLADGTLITESSLAEMLDQHKQWLLSGGREGKRLELQQAALSYVDLSGVNLSRVDFSYADISEANLSKANLSCADFSVSDMSYINLSEANLSNANLSHANLSNAKLSLANFSEANLCNANLSSAEIFHANLSEADLSRAKLCNANLTVSDLSRAKFFVSDLSEADLSGANLSEAIFLVSDLSRANLSVSNLSGAKLIGAKFVESKYRKGIDSWGKHGEFIHSKFKSSEVKLSEFRLSEVKLSGANLSGANLSAVDLSGADLTEANLSNANLFKANLSGANLNNATLSEVDCSEAIYESVVGIPAKGNFLSINGIDTMTYETQDGYAGLVLLRNAFKESGLREAERQATYVIESGKLEHMSCSNLGCLFEKGFRTVMFLWPCAFGLYPGRPVLILLSLIPLFAVLYFFAIRQGYGRGGIYQVWIADRLPKHIGSETPKRVYATGFAAVRWALYFSILSACRIGWRELNPGSWIVNMQRREYLLKPTDWVRTVSGIQALTSVYLLALAVLTYFGRPFE